MVEPVGIQCVCAVKHTMWQAPLEAGKVVSSAELRLLEAVRAGSASWCLQCVGLTNPLHKCAGVCVLSYEEGA
jgi:hypothetical protein